MKIIYIVPLLIIGLLSACTSQPAFDNSAANTALLQQHAVLKHIPHNANGNDHSISARAIKALKELYIVKKLQLLLLKSITDEHTTTATYQQLERLELEKNALVAEIGKAPTEKTDASSQRSRLSVISSKITSEELRLKNLRSYSKFKKKLQTRTAIADNIPLYTPSQLTPRQAIDIEQNKPFVLQEIAMALDAWPTQKPALRQAERQISDLIAVAPDYAPVWIQLARWHMKRVEHDGLKYRFRRYQRVEEAIAKAMQLEPKNGNAWAVWGELAILNKQWYDAKSRLRKAVALKADDPWLPINLGRTAKHINDDNAAYGYYRQAIKVRNSHNATRSFPIAMGWGQLARLNLYRGQVRKAQDAFETQIEYIPRAGIAKSQYADELLYAAGEYNRVIELAEKLGADVSTTTHAMAHYLRWATHAKRGDSTKAMQSLLKGQQILPNLDHAMSLVGRFRQSEHLEILTSYLNNQGVSINAKNHLGQTALHTAITYTNIDGVEALIDMGAEVNSLDNRYNSPLLHAVHQQNAKIVALLIQLGANPEQRYEITDSSPLSFAVLHEDINTIEVLIAANVDVNAIDNNGLSLLTLAVSTSNHKVIEQIADAGGEFKGKIDGRWTPAQFAEAIGNKQLANLVRSIR